MATFPCPACAQPLEAENTYRDWTVRCPHCAVEFVPEEVARDAFDDRSRDAEDPEPRSGGRRARVYGPGLWLELCGWLFGFLIELGGSFRSSAR